MTERNKVRTKRKQSSERSGFIVCVLFSFIFLRFRCSICSDFSLVSAGILTMRSNIRAKWWKWKIRMKAHGERVEKKHRNRLSSRSRTWFFANTLIQVWEKTICPIFTVNIPDWRLRKQDTYSINFYLNVNKCQLASIRESLLAPNSCRYHSYMSMHVENTLLAAVAMDLVSRNGLLMQTKWASNWKVNWTYKCRILSFVLVFGKWQILNMLTSFEQLFF